MLVVSDMTLMNIYALSLDTSSKPSLQIWAPVIVPIELYCHCVFKLLSLLDCEPSEEEACHVLHCDPGPTISLRCDSLV